MEKLLKLLSKFSDMRPSAIIERLKLKSPIYTDTAAYGHMGRTPELKTYSYEVEGTIKELPIETFTWEKLDYIEQIKSVFEI